MREVFVSYASADQALADRLVRGLESRHLQCWIASREILGGLNYQREIPGAIAACRTFLLLHSRQAAANPQEIEKEMSIARRAKKPFIPVRLDDSTPEGSFLFELATTQWIDMFPDFDTGLQRLSLRLGALCERQAEVERRDRVLARLRMVRIWSFRAALVVIACLGAALAWKAAPILHAMTNPAGTPAADTAMPQGRADGPPPESGPARRARQFATQYWAMAGAPLGQWVQFQSVALGDPVSYFGRRMVRAQFIEMQRGYAVRWPQRHFEVRPQSMTVVCDQSGRSCTVEGIDDYVLHKQSRTGGIVGADRFTMQINTAPTQLMAITGKQIESHAQSNDAAAP